MTGASERSKHTYLGQYVTANGAENLKHYKYSGADNSPIYKHALSPLAQTLVDKYVPSCIAPNLITLSGIVIVFTSHLTFLYYCPRLEGEAPTWAYIWAGVSLFMYQTLDNMDGKQARKTGTSSPLGLLFDHGCDALTVIISLITHSAALQLGPNWTSKMLVWIGSLTFYFATWEEFYTGTLELPPINGPTEGILIGVFVQFLTAIMGPSFWLQESLGLRHNTWFVIITAVAAVPTVGTNIVNVYNSVRKTRESLFIAITRVLPFILLNSLVIVWIMTSPADIMDSHPRLVLWTVGLLNAKLVLHLMLAHLMIEEYHPFRKTLVPIFFIAAHTAYSAFLGKYHMVDEEIILYEFFFISSVSYGHMVISVVYEVSSVLNVPILTMPPVKSE